MTRTVTPPLVNTQTKFITVTTNVKISVSTKKKAEMRVATITSMISNKRKIEIDDMLNPNEEDNKPGITVSV